jgi:hypothetical protein
MYIYIYQVDFEAHKNNHHRAAAIRGQQHVLHIGRQGLETLGVLELPQDLRRWLESWVKGN